MRMLFVDYPSAFKTIVPFRLDTKLPTPHQEDWCHLNNLQLNVSKTKELIVDFIRAAEELHATHHQWDAGGRSGMDHPHQRCGEEGPTASLPPETSEGLQHPHGKHHHVVGDWLSWTDHQNHSPPPSGHLHQALQDPDRLHSALPEIIFTAAFR